MRRKPQQARSREKVGRILAAARTVVLRDGPDGFNTNRIAKEAGVGIGSLYEYFPDKQSIVTQLIEQIASRESEIVLARLGELDDREPAELVEAVVAVVFDLYLENHLVYQALWSLSSATRDVGSRPGERLIMADVRRYLTRHADALGIDSIDLATFTVFHLVESLAHRMAAHGVTQFGKDACRREITRAALRYLGLA